MSRLRGKRVVVTAGPTREHIDAVRVITNPSSGRMGYAVAEAAFARGADVALITGPTALPPPPGIEPIPVTSTEELCAAVEQHLREADVLIMAAAPADYRPGTRADDKLSRGDGPISITLEPTPDVLESTRGARGKTSVMVGFALEAGDGLARAKQKLRQKRLHLIVLNHVEPGSGFDVETNRVTLITSERSRDLDVLPKREVAERILDEVEQLL